MTFLSWCASHLEEGNMRTRSLSCSSWTQSSIDICWTNEWIFKWIFKVILSLFSVIGLSLSLVCLKWEDFSQTKIRKQMHVMCSLVCSYETQQECEMYFSCVQNRAYHHHHLWYWSEEGTRVKKSKRKVWTFHEQTGKPFQFKIIFDNV